MKASLTTSHINVQPVSVQANPFESNNDMGHAAFLTPGVYYNLVVSDKDDWFKVIVDISDPYHPTRVGTCSTEQSSARDRGLRIIDISDR